MRQADNVVQLPRRTENPVKALLENLLSHHADYSKVIVSIEDKNGKVIHQVAKTQ